MAFRGRYSLGGSYVQKVLGSKESSPKWQSPISSITKGSKAINCLSNVFKISWTATSFDVGYETSHISPSLFVDWKDFIAAFSTWLRHVQWGR